MKETLDMNILDELATAVNDCYKAVDCMYEFGFTKRYFDEPKYNDKDFRDKARIQYHILGGEILALGDAVNGLVAYIKELENDKDKG